eukprot:gene28790-31978_t
MGSDRDEGRDDPMEERESGREEPRSCDPSEFKTFVGGLSWQIKDVDLKEAFSKYEPVGATIILDKNTQRPRGFGFVFFKDKLAMEDAIRDMHEKEIDGRRISVVHAVPQDMTKPGTPAGRLGGGSGARRGGGRDRGHRGGPGGDRYGGSGGDRGGDRYGGGGDRFGGGDRYGGADRYGGGGGERYGRDRGMPERERGYGMDRYSAYPDPRYAAYERGYRGDPHARVDPYARGDPYARESYPPREPAYPPRDPYERDPYAYAQADPYADGRRFLEIRERGSAASSQQQQQQLYTAGPPDIQAHGTSMSSGRS